MTWVLLGLFAAGVFAALAVAGPPAGKGKGKDDATTSTASSAPSTEGTTTTATSKKITLCHLTGSKSHPYVKVSISTHAAKAHEKKGDIAPDASGNCPAAAPAGVKGKGKDGGETTSTATTTAHA